MRFKVSYLLAVALACTILTLVSCKGLSIGVGSGHKQKHGLPPHAPAHGYRHKHQRVELVYDSGRGVYVVIDFPHHYYFKGHYYRLRETQWEVGVHIDGPWEFVSEGSLPPGLRAKEKGKANRKSIPAVGSALKRKSDDCNSRSASLCETGTHHPDKFLASCFHSPGGWGLPPPFLLTNLFLAK